MKKNQKEKYSVEDLLLLIKTLRSPEGCPWDKKQTHQSMKRNFIEETYEVIDAIEAEDVKLLQEELGDVLLQVLFHSILQEEMGGFSFSDVTSTLGEKLVRRHPHVFATKKASTPSEALASWDESKAKEKEFSTPADRLRDVPKCFPALMRSQKVQRRATKDRVLRTTLTDEIETMSRLLSTLPTSSYQTKDVGELLFSLSSLAELLDIDAEEALRHATDDFILTTLEEQET